MALTSDVLTDNTQLPSSTPPRLVKLGAVDWAKRNLFSSVFNTILTALFGLGVFAAWRGLLAFTFSDERQWDAVSTNLRLLFTAAYPQEQYGRIWVCVGILAGLVGLSVAVYNAAGRIAVHQLAQRAFIVGGVIMGSGLLAPFSGSARVWYLSIGAAILAVGVLARVQTHEDASLPLIPILGIAVALPVLSLWVVPYGHHAFTDDGIIAVSGTVARTTSGPWTVVMLVAFGMYLAVAKLIPPDIKTRLRGATVGLWLVSPLFLVFIILRDPAFDYDEIVSREVPILLLFAAVGGILLYWLTKPGLGEVGRIIAAAVLIVGFASFFTPRLQLIRILVLVLALFALAAPTFSGGTAARRRYVTVWVTVVVGLVWFVTAANAPSTVDTFGDWFPGGFSMTLMVATFTLIFSFPIGVILALARTSKMPIFRVMSTTYIEVVRGVPFITVLVFFVIMVPLFLPRSMELSNIAAVIIAYSLFSAAYLAENVRGGLQSIRTGQHEAAEALGMTGTQKTVFIVLPQALRASIPPLVGQTIGTFKETSLLAIIGVFDLLFVARTLIPTQTLFLGSMKEGLLVISLIYWFFTFNMSKASQRLEQKLGVGER
jgi:His/Glu/Gln/Arg/opine family amino acid ABC transporter permease subunit